MNELANCPKFSRVEEYVKIVMLANYLKFSREDVEDCVKVNSWLIV